MTKQFFMNRRESHQPIRFPNPRLARADGLLAWGGNLLPETLLTAYSMGIFPWFAEGQPILWWAPAPRCILRLENFHLPRRSARKLRARPFDLTFDKAFARVIRACAATRPGQDGTWITAGMIQAYEKLHSLGYAHSVEAWRAGELAGGLYGVTLGKAFFGESMFHLEPEASRAALEGLVKLLKQLGFSFIDCQQATPHMLGMGARPESREAFMELLEHAVKPDCQDSGETGQQNQTAQNAGDRHFPWKPLKI